MQTTNSARLQLIFSMVLFGTIGIFVRYISLPSGLIALVRGAVGAAFLTFVALQSKNKISLSTIKKNALMLILSGIFIGLNWVLLFESYRYTTVATATLCYYMAPMFVLLLSPFVLNERLTFKKLFCVIISLVGMAFVSGIFKSGVGSFSEIKGIALSLGAAMLYATVVLFNAKIKKISAYDKTIVQLSAAALIMVPYFFAFESGAALNITVGSVILLITVGILHTGIAYALYFGAIGKLGAATTAILSYIDPIVAVVLSALLLKEPLTVQTVIGAALILGASVLSETSKTKKH